MILHRLQRYCRFYKHTFSKHGCRLQVPGPELDASIVDLFHVAKHIVVAILRGSDDVRGAGGRWGEGDGGTEVGKWEEGSKGGRKGRDGKEVHVWMDRGE